MKRFRLPKGAKAQIRTWLELPSFEDVNRGSFERHKEGYCPFLGLRGHYCETVCNRMFPSLKRDEHNNICPCHVLTLNYVIKRAKEIIR